MPPIDTTILQGFIDTGANAPNAAVKGRALEDLICYLFGLVPGISITHRNVMNQFNTEEIDVALWNDQDGNGFSFLPYTILIEAKNWSSAVSSNEVSWFDTKLKNHGLDFGILISPLGITGDAAHLTAAHLTVAHALKEKRKFIVIATAELLALPDTDALARLIKLKLCELAVRGAIA
ncbi:restriction endonuclease [Tardiphaga sp. 619_E2_N8_5]|uniref:restriction endonuclease n=1 Tax=unclassified Tardiphaga TaxID=2631404 RepID=UPI003F1E854C